MWPTLRNAVCLLPACLMIIFLLTPSANAHHLWVVAQEDVCVVARGTVPDDLEAYNPDAVTSVKAFDRKGGEIPIERVNEKVRVIFRPKKAPAIAVVMCDWGSRVKTTRGKKLMTRSKAEQQGFKVLESFLSTQTSKSLFEDGDAVCKRIGMKFELVPTKSPFQIAPGEPLDVQLFFDGAPLKNVTVSTADHVRTKTDENGIARIAGGCKGGWNIVMARHRVSGAGDPAVNYHQFMTFLLFKVP